MKNRKNRKIWKNGLKNATALSCQVLIGETWLKPCLSTLHSFATQNIHVWLRHLPRSDRCPIWNPIKHRKWRHVTSWRRNFFKISGNVPFTNILVVWKFQVRTIVQTEIIIDYVCLRNTKKNIGNPPVILNTPLISEVQVVWSWNFHRLRKIDKN